MQINSSCHSIIHRKSFKCLLPLKWTILMGGKCQNAFFYWHSWTRHFFRNTKNCLNWKHIKASQWDVHQLWSNWSVLRTCVSCSLLLPMTLTRFMRAFDWLNISLLFVNDDKLTFSDCSGIWQHLLVHLVTFQTVSLSLSCTRNVTITVMWNFFPIETLLPFLLPSCMLFSFDLPWPLSR